MNDTTVIPSLHDWPTTHDTTIDTSIQTVIAVARAVDKLRQKKHHKGEVAIELLTNAIVMMFRLSYEEARGRSIVFWERFGQETSAAFAAEAAVGSEPDGLEQARCVLDKMIPPRSEVAAAEREMPDNVLKFTPPANSA